MTNETSNAEIAKRETAESPWPDGVAPKSARDHVANQGGA